MSSSGYNANNQVIINRALIETVKPDVLAALYEQVPPCREAIKELYPEGFAFGFQFNSKVGKPIKIIHDIKFQDMIDYYVDNTQVQNSREGQFEMEIDGVQFDVIVQDQDSDEEMGITLKRVECVDPHAIAKRIDVNVNEISKCSLVIFNVMGEHSNIERYTIDAKLMNISVVKFVNFKTSTTSKFVVNSDNIVFEKCSKIPVEMFPVPEDTLSEEYLTFAKYPKHITIIDQHIDCGFDLEKLREMVKDTNLNFKRCTFDPSVRLNIRARDFDGNLICMIDFLQCDFSTSQFYDLLSGSQLAGTHLTKCLNFFRERNFQMNPSYGTVRMNFTKKTGICFFTQEFGWRRFDYRKKQRSIARPIAVAVPSTISS